jgi:hypothetical protein
MAFCPGTPKEESRNYPNLNSEEFARSYLFAQTSDLDEVWSKLVYLLESFPTMCRTPPAHIGVRLIPDF